MQRDRGHRPRLAFEGSDQLPGLTVEQPHRGVGAAADDELRIRRHRHGGDGIGVSGQRLRRKRWQRPQLDGTIFRRGQQRGGGRVKRQAGDRSGIGTEHAQRRTVIRIPQPHDARRVTAGQLQAILRDGQSPDRCVVAREVAEQFALDAVPHLDRLVVSRCRQPFAVGIHDDRIHRPRVTGQLPQRCGNEGLPQLHTVVARSAGDLPSARTDGQGQHLPGVPFERSQLGPGGGVPDLQRLVEAARHDQLAIGREAGGGNSVLMSSESGRRLLGTNGGWECIQEQNTQPEEH